MKDVDYKIIRNRARCLLCGDVLESETRHDRQTCSCGNLTVDGGQDYLKRTWKHDESSFEELNELDYYQVSDAPPDLPEDELIAQGWIQDPDSGEWRRSILAREAQAYYERVEAFEGDLPDSLLK